MRSDDKAALIGVDQQQTNSASQSATCVASSLSGGFRT